jgi:HSP20 family molecular chaperone IbpA
MKGEMPMKKNSELSTPSEKSVERATARQVIAPAVDIFENADEVLMIADFPGVDSDGVNLHFEKNRLTLEGRPREEGPAPSPSFDYSRTFIVPGGIDSEKIRAELKAGVLTVHLPKQERLKPRQIRVTAA